MQQSANHSYAAITHVNIQDVVVNRIRNMILSGHFKPGARLRQDDLANTFGVSTMPIREALRQLQTEGLVIYLIREELETLACRWAAEDFERVPIDRLKRLLEEIETAEASQDDVHRRIALVREFFFTIFEASEKEHLLRILSNLWDLSQQYRFYFYSFRELDSQRLTNYRNLYQACHDRDPEALISAFRVIWSVRDHILKPLVREEENKKQTT
jgi:DNA-binding GntR family transcriptional regulator